MRQDVSAVMWKEWKELVRYEGSRVGGAVRVALFGVVGLILAQLMGPDFGASWRTVLVTSFVGCLAVLPVVTASFAGERDQRTLEALLATPISDRALLLGKYAATVTYGWGVAMGAMLLGILIPSFGHAGNPGFQVRVDVVAGSALISLLVAGAVAGLGLHVSLRAPSVKDATQTLALLMIGLTLGPTLMARLVPATWTANLGSSVPRISAGVALVVLSSLLLGLNAALLGLAVVRFQRARLILD
jgi:ABC-2 type transport system permease protein